MKAFRRGGQVRTLIEWAEKHGWKVQITNGNHLQFYHAMAGMVFSSFSPSDRRAYLNARADMRRKMIEVGFNKESVR